MPDNRKPTWVITNKESVRRECEPWIGKTPQEHWDAFKQVCYFGAKLAALHKDPQRIRAWQDPIDERAKTNIQRMKDAGKRRTNI